MSKSIKKEFTVEEFQANFDSLFQRVENGETFTIFNGKHRCLIMPIDQMPHRWRASD